MILLSKDNVQTVTFTLVDRVPATLNSVQPPCMYFIVTPDPDRPVCAVTGLPAPYRDPKTGKAYANADAFKTIREQYLKEEQAKVDSRLSQLNGTCKSF